MVMNLKKRKTVKEGAVKSHQGLKMKFLIFEFR